MDNKNKLLLIVLIVVVALILLIWKLCTPAAATAPAKVNNLPDMGGAYNIIPNSTVTISPETTTVPAAAQTPPPATFNTGSAIVDEYLNIGL